MAIIDEEGDLFGRWNAVDALAVAVVVLLVAAAAVVGASALRSDPEPVQTQVVEVRSVGNPPAAAAAVRAGPVSAPGIVEVLNVSTTVANGNRTLDLLVRLRIEFRDGLAMYAGERLYIGREVNLTLDGVNVTGVVVGAREPEALRRTPTPTPTPSPSPTPTPPPTTATTPSVSTAPPPTTTSTPPTRAPELTPSVPLTEGTRTVTVEADVSEAVLEALETGPVDSAGVVEVLAVDETPTDDGYRAVIEVVLRVRTTDDGAVLFNGVELGEGGRVVLDLGDAVVVATVTER